ncbi:MAG: hypothetical protein K2M34_04575 [Alphaproteobacteria bacterium]|nr:hypothetical protein [Alphaproteobacteria bacterium]
MASRTPLDKRIISVLKYDVSRPYFGEFTFSDLYNAQGTMRRSEYYDENGSRDMRVYVGKINGDVICGALWRLMEYNPRRFVSNPFWYNGKMNIYRFAADITLPADVATANVIAGVRGKLREYLIANSTPNGQWRDEIETENGFVYTVLNDGRTGPMYKKLCLLRDAIKIVTSQNCADFAAKRKPYREFIIKAVERLHPKMFVQQPQPAPVAAPVSAPVTTVSNYDDEYYRDMDRIYDQMDQLQIILDNKSSVSPELYEQAFEDMDKLMYELREFRSVHTL